jgi:hypothetical protein
MIRIQWILLSDTGASLVLPTSVTVPEEVSLAQLWHRHIANRLKRQIESVKWGKHYRAGSEFESGQVSDLQDGDSVEIIVASGPAPSGQLEVVYTLEGESIVNRFNIKNTATMGDVRSRISQMHKGTPIPALMFEGSTFADEDSFNDWALRSGGVPRQIVAKVLPLVQVIVDYMEVERHMAVRVGTSKSEFLNQVKTFLGTSHNLDATPLGLDAWEIRAEVTYDIRETRQITLKCKDAGNRDFTIKIQGNKEIEDVQEACRQHWGFGPWIRVAISRADGKNFFLQDGALYSVAATYDSSLDTRLNVTLRIDLSDRTYFIPNFRLEDDPAKVLKTLKTKYGLPLERTRQVRFSPDKPWSSDQTICVTVKIPISCSKVTLPPYSRRQFTLFIADDPWESGEVVFSSSYGKARIWAHLQTLHPIPDVSQFQAVCDRTDLNIIRAGNLIGAVRLAKKSRVN